MRTCSFLAFLAVLIFPWFHLSTALTEELVPTKPAPFHNLIPRFKMPPGNLLRYKIPQWEVLYFLKHGYGKVPFVFYDPHFNRTHFINQVHKFKMYFDDTPPKETFGEFLEKHGYPNYNQLSESVLAGRNNKIVEELNGLLEAASNSQQPIMYADGGEKGETNLDSIMEDLDRIRQRQRASSEIFAVGKRGNMSEEIYRKDTGGHNFWNNFITRYPLTWKYTRSVVGTRNLLLNHASSWMPERFPYYSAFGRNTKSFRIGTRNVNDMASADGETEEQRGSGSGDGRRGGKQFQTQGW